MNGVEARDVDGRIAGLRDFDNAPVSALLGVYLRCHYDRVVLTGTGAAHFAALPAWRRLSRAGRAAHWIPTNELSRRSDDLFTRSLVILACPSGHGAHISELLNRSIDAPDGATIISITADAKSPLAMQADCAVLLGTRYQTPDDITVYLNMLAVHDVIASMLLSEDCDEVATTVDAVADLASPRYLCDTAAAHPRSAGSRLAFIGFFDHAATALYAARLADDVGGEPARALVGELIGENIEKFVGPSSTAVIFVGRGACPNLSVRRLAARLQASGAAAVIAECTGSTATAELACGAVIANAFAHELARRAELRTTAVTSAIAVRSFHG